MKQQKRIEDYRWVETEGAPFLLTPVSTLSSWTGYESDYDLVIDATDRESSDFYTFPGRNLVILGDEALRTTVQESRSLIIQWVYSNSEEEILRLSSEVDLESIRWREGPELECDGNVALVDAATPGAGVDVGEVLTFELGVGVFRIYSANVQLAAHCEAKLYRWVAPGI